MRKTEPSPTVTKDTCRLGRLKLDTRPTGDGVVAHQRVSAVVECLPECWVDHFVVVVFPGVTASAGRPGGAEPARTELVVRHPVHNLLVERIVVMDVDRGKAYLLSVAVKGISNIMYESGTTKEDDPYVHEDHRVESQNILDDLAQVRVPRAEQPDCLLRHTGERHIAPDILRCLSNVSTVLQVFGALNVEVESLGRSLKHRDWTW